MSSSSRNAGGGGVGERQTSLGDGRFQVDPTEEVAFPSASRINGPFSAPAGSSGAPPAPAGGFLRSMFGNFGGLTAAGGMPRSALRPIKTPHESPSHPELVCSPTDVGVWEFSRFTPATPKSPSPLSTMAGAGAAVAGGKEAAGQGPKG